VTRKLAEVTWSAGLQGKRSVGDPDALAIEVHFSGFGVAGGLLGTSSGKQRPVEEREFRFPGWVRNGDREYAGVFVIHLAGIDATIRRKGRQPHALPVEEVLRYCPGDPGASGRERCVSHDVTLQRFHESNTRIFAASAAIRAPLIIGFRLKRDAQPLDAYRIASFIEPHSCNADSRVISPRNQPREEVEFTVRATSGSRIQDAFDLLGVTRLRLHQHSEAL
jgi:hypothetical protein